MDLRPERRMTMFKENKKTLFITCAVILLPIVAGLLLWDRLPDRIPTHWGMGGEVDGWSSKGFAVFAMPALMLGIQLLCFFVTASDPKRGNIRRKYLSMVLWIIPVLSVMTSCISYAVALGAQIRVEQVIPGFIGLMFVIIGNYMPKFQQSYTMGIRLPWTLSSEENWNRTHRFGGKIWALGGIGVLFCTLMGWGIASIAILAVVVIVPTVYSYVLYRKGI